jgi:hypothetical protein
MRIQDKVLITQSQEGFFAEENPERGLLIQTGLRNHPPELFSLDQIPEFYQHFIV